MSRARLLQEVGLSEPCDLSDVELWFEYELQCLENGEAPAFELQVAWEREGDL